MKTVMENMYKVQFRQNGGLNVTPVTPIFIKVLQKVLRKKSSRIKDFRHFVTPVTPIFKYKYKKICEIAELQIALFL